MESIMIIGFVYCFIIGACLASFMNVVIDRVPRGESFVTGRSHCDVCGKTIKGYDLIPVISYLLLKGKCRYCHSHIPIRGFIIEIIGGLMGMLCFYRYQLDINVLFSLAVGMILLGITMIDHDTMIIPDGMNIALFIISIAWGIYNQQDILTGVIGMFCISVPMFLLTLMIPDCFGGGDIKLMFAAGYVLGWPQALLATFIGIILAGIYAIYLMIRGKVTKESHIAFGPYLSIGIFVSLLYGTQIINMYLNLFM